MTIFDRWNRTPANKRIQALLPRYCGRCGKVLERAEQSLGFSVTDGRPQFEYWLTCPDAEKKDTPYVPSYLGSTRARYVACDLSGWAEEEERFSFIHLSSFVSCEPWPKPTRFSVAEPAPDIDTTSFDPGNTRGAS